MTLIAQGDGWHVRLATRADNDALVHLMREVPMEGLVSLAQDRSPDFFAADRAHEPGSAETGIAIDERSGEAVACGTYVMRDAWWPDGARRPVGYLFDVRIRPSHRKAKILPAWGKGAFERARHVHQTEVFLTSFVASNRRVRRAAAGDKPERADQPVTRPLTRYDLVSVQITRHRPRAHRDVRRATPADLDEIARFLAEGQRGRAFGYVLDRKALESRFETWPGLRIDDFRLAFDVKGALVGCCAPWDAAAVKRNMAISWHGPMRAYRVAYNAARAIHGGAPLPGPGEAFRFSTLSHVEVKDDDPEVMRALLADVLPDARARRQHFVGAMVVQGSPLARAFRGLLASRTRLILNATTLHDSPYAGVEFDARRPGFEMAIG